MTHKLMLTLLVGIGMVAAIAVLALDSDTANAANVGGTFAVAIIALTLTAGSSFYTGFARNLFKRNIFRRRHVFVGAAALTFSWLYLVFSTFVPPQPVRSMLRGEYYAMSDSVRVNILAGAVGLLVCALLYGTATLAKYVLKDRRGR